ncbi:unnamed protein product, partial [Amoebophrya sp. A120]
REPSLRGRVFRSYQRDPDSAATRALLQLAGGAERGGGAGGENRPSSRDIKRHMEQTQSSLLKNRCAVKVAAAAARAGAQNKANTKHKRTSSTGGATLNTEENESNLVGNMQLPNQKQKQNQKQSRFSDSAQRDRDTSPRTPTGAVGRKTRHSPSHGTSSGGAPGTTGHNKSDQDRSYSSFISEIAAEESSNELFMQEGSSLLGSSAGGGLMMVPEEKDGEGGGGFSAGDSPVATGAIEMTEQVVSEKVSKSS